MYVVPFVTIAPINSVDLEMKASTDFFCQFAYCFQAQALIYSGYLYVFVSKLKRDGNLLPASTGWESSLALLSLDNF